MDARSVGRTTFRRHVIATLLQAGGERSLTSGLQTRDNPKHWSTVGHSRSQLHCYLQVKPLTARTLVLTSIRSILSKPDPMEVNTHQALNLINFNDENKLSESYNSGISGFACTYITTRTSLLLDNASIYKIISIRPTLYLHKNWLSSTNRGQPQHNNCFIFSDFLLQFIVVYETDYSPPT